jgi:hypothetical protein
MNTADFRKNLRRAFNEADNGREVLIERYGQTYKLVSLVGDPDVNGSYPLHGYDPVEDDGTPITAGSEHEVRFVLPDNPNSEKQNAATAESQ